jgi:hypothetical protein
VGNEHLERVGGGAVDVEVEDTVENGCALLIYNLVDQRFDGSVTESPTTVGIAKEVSYD